MASLEYIQFIPFREAVKDGIVDWERDRLARAVKDLPQIFWKDGEGWPEANLWALQKVLSTKGGHIKTVTTLMKHLAAYAGWLEDSRMDWRHFPKRESDRVLHLYRGFLINCRKDGMLAPSTATARMAAVIQFYRYAQLHGFVGLDSPLWNDRMAIIRYFDSVGFERTMQRLTSDLTIPNRRRPGVILEDALTPLSGEHMQQLLSFTARERLNELHLMLCLGFFTGARIGTITTLNVKDIEDAEPDSRMPSFYSLPVGPGTGVETKFDVTGNLLVPAFLIDELRTYVYSMSRLRRQALAAEEDRSKLFLTTRGNRYMPQSFNRLMTDLRRSAMRSRLRFMSDFRFHQTRCTYGTWLMELAMRVADPASAIAFVRDAMLHKDEAMTLRYVIFRTNSKVKAEVSNEFSSAFAGVTNRDWNSHHA